MPFLTSLWSKGANQVGAEYTMGDRFLRILCYADDAVIIAENEDDLQRLLNKFKTTAERFNMLIFRKKTQVMIPRERSKNAGKQSRIADYFSDIVWRNKYMSTKNKIRIYKTCIRPILTYAAETRVETSRTKKMMRTTEMRILRAIKGVSLRDILRQ
ncbi:hypothetical protein ACFW04_013665 [Cataglyphis niger]